MNRPVRRPGSSFPYFRKRVPADVLRLAKGQLITFTFPGEQPGDPEVHAQAKISAEVKVSLQTRDPAVAKQRNGLATAQFERLCTAIRNGPRTLQPREREALSGVLYSRIQRAFHDDPGDARWWRIVREVADFAQRGGFSALVIGAEAQATVRRSTLERCIGPWVDAVLRSEALLIDDASRTQLLERGAWALRQIAAQLERNAEGDYRTDPDADRFPTWERNDRSKPTKRAESLTFGDLFDRWRNERKPSASTIATWKPCIRSLQDHVGHDNPALVTKADIVSWKDALIAGGRSAKGFRDGPLAAVRSLFNYAVDNNLLTTNPTKGITVRHSQKAGTGMLNYTDDEVAALLALADRQEHPARRWLPWLCALSGARVGELAQLWGKRIVSVDGILVMKIAPAEDGGSLKNVHSERDVPIHPAILERDFLDFVRAKGDGPLFYGRSKKHGGRHVSKGVSNHLAGWIREQGFIDRRKAPNHALRHWFKSACQRLGVQDSLADAIQGQVGARGEADRYRHPDVKTKAEAIARILVPKVRAQGIR